MPSWGHFRPLGRPSSGKFGLKPVLKACQRQKRDFSPRTRPRVRERKFPSQDGLQNAPRSAQDGSKTVLEGHFGHVKNRTDFGCVLASILDHFGSQNASLLAPLWRPKSVQKSIENWTALNVTARSPQDRPRRPPDRFPTLQAAPKKAQERSKSPLGRSWSLLDRSWAFLGPS